MALGQAALLKCATNLESKESIAFRLNPAFVSTLEAWLLSIYHALRPGPTEYEQRAGLVMAFNELAKDAFGANGRLPFVEAFGSFVMDLFTTESDLDLSINFTDDHSTEIPRGEKISKLRKFTRFLYKVKRKSQISNIVPVLRARVPVVKVVDNKTRIECDVSAENKDGVSRSSILTVVASIDGRFQTLSYLMKAWAKAHDINSSKDRTMNSLSIISLVAFHLQTRDPPILPQFSAFFKDGTDISRIRNTILGFKDFGKSNNESVAELFITLLVKLSAVENLWPQGLCASTYEGSWIKKEWQNGIGNMSIEDFLDRSQNCARSVGIAEMKKINSCVKASLKHLSCVIEGKIGESDLKSLFVSIHPKASVNPLTIKGTGSKRTKDRAAKREAKRAAKRAWNTEDKSEAKRPNLGIPQNQPSLPVLIIPSEPFQSIYQPLLLQQEPRTIPRHTSQHILQLPLSGSANNPQYLQERPAPRSGYFSNNTPSALESRYVLQPQTAHHRSGNGPDFQLQPPSFPPPVGYRAEYPQQHPFATAHHRSGNGPDFQLQPPSFPPPVGYRAEYTQQHPFASQLSYGIQHQQPHLQHQLSSALGHHQQPQNGYPQHLGLRPHAFGHFQQFYRPDYR